MFDNCIRKLQDKLKDTKRQLMQLNHWQWSARNIRDQHLNFNATLGRAHDWAETLQYPWTSTSRCKRRRRESRAKAKFWWKRNKQEVLNITNPTRPSPYYCRGSLGLYRSTPLSIIPKLNILQFGWDYVCGVGREKQPLELIQSVITDTHTHTHTHTQEATEPG